MYRRSLRSILSLVLFLGFVSASSSVARADEVLEWNAVTMRAIVVASTPGALGPRLSAIVHVSMFDALNGVDRRFTPIHVDAEAPKGASRRAAVVYAAYTALVALFPAQSDAFADDLELSLAGIAAGAANENSESIALGRAWGEDVAGQVLAWRAADGLNPPAPPYLGSLDVGKWRPTPRPGATPADPELPGLPGLAPTLATTEPFVIPHPWSFRPLGPPALTSEAYAASVNEVKLVGENTSIARSADQTQSARFWAGTALTFWNRTAASASRDAHLTLSENARLFALLNVAAADAVIGAWDSKYFFELWRPITAIRLADTDGNDATVANVTWTPLIVTPNYPEYYSGHQSISGTAQAILTAYFGNAPVEGFSEALSGVVRSWPSFAAAADEAFLARIWGGMHFRFAMRDTRVIAEEIAAYILAHAAQPLHGGHAGQLPD
jgi:PAP2 superfamily